MAALMILVELPMAVVLSLLFAALLMHDPFCNSC
jgi:hypothetical protein